MNGEGRRLSLRFSDAQAEAAFRSHDDELARPRALVAMPFCVVIYGIFALLDPFIVDQYDGRMLVPRAAGAGGLLVVALALRNPRTTRYQAQLVAAGLVAAGLGLDVAAAVAGVPHYYLTGGAVFCQTFLLTIGVVRMRLALPVWLLLLVGYGAALPFTGQRSAVVLADVTLVVGSGIFLLVAAWTLEQLRRRDHLSTLALQRERDRSDRLLLNVLPATIAARLRDRPATIADAHEEATVLFADVVAFTPLAAALAPAEVVTLLDRLFTEFDALCRVHGVEKIKTIGDAYMAVGGVPEPRPDHAVAVAEVALGMLEVCGRFRRWPGGLQLRIGIASGPVVAGVIGTDKFTYDLWGDTVNTASRMESQGAAGRIHITAETGERLGGQYRILRPMWTDIKGKGSEPTYFLERRVGYTTQSERPAT